VADQLPKRRFPRIASQHAVLVTKAGPEKLEEFAKTRDLGLGGCMFLSEEAIGVGSVIEVLISVAGRVVATTARVVYENAGDRRFEVGVEFLRLHASDREFLQSFFDADPEG
jgi:PilZ domain